MKGILGIKTSLTKGNAPEQTGRAYIRQEQFRLLLGQTRLSILDLSPAGHQPIRSPDGRYTITYNGDVYNYREMR